jgi:hypothetical protein
MPVYDAQRFSPPAPLAHVICKNLDTGAVLADVPMLLDTGADVSLLPQVVVNQLDLAAMPDRRYELVGFDGHVSTAPVVRTAIIFCGRNVPGTISADRAGVRCPRAKYPQRRVPHAGWAAVGLE